MLTKKDFVALADEFEWLYGACKNSYDSEFRISVVNSLVNFCRKSNPSFNEGKFRKYLQGSHNENSCASFLALSLNTLYLE